MRWAVIGSNGLFGQDLLAYLNVRGEDAQGFHRGNLKLSDDANQISPQLSGCDIWVNCIGYTQVDEAESEIYEANLVNGIYAGALAQAAAIAGARFIHISTDYVFDGLSKIPYKTLDSIEPKTSYGKSKALGEKLVGDSGADYSIVRTAWLYGAMGECFPRIIADSLRKRGRVRVVNDQFGQPTWTRDLAEKVFQVAQLEKMPRIIHAVASGETNWAIFAREIACSLGMQNETVEEISTADRPTPAKRPEWSVLDNSSDAVKPIADWRERWRVAAPDVLRGI